MRTLTKYVLLLSALFLFSGCIVTIYIQPDKENTEEEVGFVGTTTALSSVGSSDIVTAVNREKPLFPEDVFDYLPIEDEVK